MNEFVNWETLATYGGALAMVMVLTQFTKGLGFVDKIPTQIWSYILSFVVLICAMVFTSGLTFNTFIQTAFNAVIVSIAANGGFSAFQRAKEKSTDD